MDETAVAIATIDVKNEFAETWINHRELDCLIYNALPGCADLVPNGDVKKHLDTVIQGQTNHQ